MDSTQELEITPAETSALIADGSVTLLDVRTPEEFAIARIEGSRLADEALAREILDSWPKETPIVTVCHHGVRSLSAVIYLRKEGFTNVRSMRGGIDAWSQTIDPGIPRY